MRLIDANMLTSFTMFIGNVRHRGESTGFNPAELRECKENAGGEIFCGIVSKLSNRNHSGFGLGSLASSGGRSSFLF